MLTQSVFLVRHGRYSSLTGELTSPDGIRDAERARDTLLAKGLGSTAILFTSKAPRAAHTARIIAAGLECTFYPVASAGRFGNYPGTLASLDDMIQQDLDTLDPPVTADSAIVVVTHGPLVIAALGQKWNTDADLNQAVPYGTVVEYVPGTWSTPGPA